MIEFLTAFVLRTRHVSRTPSRSHQDPVRLLQWSRIPDPIRGPVDSRNCGVGRGGIRLANNRLGREALQLNTIFVANNAGEDDNERDLYRTQPRSSDVCTWIPRCR
jgi:hypothetical protein